MNYLQTKGGSTSTPSKPKYLKDLNAEQLQTFCTSFDTVFCDCDGVVWYTLGDFIPGSADAIRQLQLQGKQLTFVTNNSICSVERHIQRFARAQLKIDKQQIVHPAQTVCDYLKSQNFEGLIYCLATASFKELLLSQGFHLVPEQQDGVQIKNLCDLRSAIQAEHQVKAVIIDVDFNMSLAKIMRAYQYLQNPQCLFIAGAADGVVPFGAGEVIGPGAFIDIVALAAGRQPVVLGKPGAGLMPILRERHVGSPPARVLFIGDSPGSDIVFARQCGYQTLLVLSGGVCAADVALDDQSAPDYVTDCLGDLTNFI
ncbi:phosphoglycolate phosphatase 1B, chloroplastic [Scaptodrosophila lebanonensis]|uniref:Phosphoglycolate phosphatase 1B, chloroplastic n=1 Tax=Drosophila lebanonensis TaxID=7225 RepID=A0A6J2UHG7_DROLE|nr:phosphoglycolate phosphatase 1B, chloroplastic [Scaptodrosophila lebanonensis]